MSLAANHDGNDTAQAAALLRYGRFAAAVGAQAAKVAVF
jgi:hypothetical protein